MLNAPVPAVSDESGRTTLRVRNMRESVVYHLMFDGDVRRLTGTQLKDHVASVCGIPSSQQILTFNNFQVTNESSGFDLGLHDGCTLLLDTMSRGPRRSQSNVSNAAGSTTTTQNNNNNNYSSNNGRQGSVADGNRSVGGNAAPLPSSSLPNNNGSSSVAAPPRSKFEEELDAAQRPQQPYRANSHLNSSEHLSHTNPYSYDVDLRRRYASQPGAVAAAAPFDDVDVDVEIEEEHGVPLWAPSNSVDLEESRLLQQDYTWRMEQVRFETERMNREREMLRQKQELDYQSELLERERIELERRTHTERLKLAMLQRTVQDEMLIEAKMSGIAEGSVYRIR